MSDRSHTPNKHRSPEGWWQSGSPWIWLTAGSVSISVIMVVGLLIIIAMRGMGHFWPANVYELQYHDPETQQDLRLIGEKVEHEEVPRSRFQQTTTVLPDHLAMIERTLLKIGNREVMGLDFRWILAHGIQSENLPVNLIVLERWEWGNFYGYLQELKESGKVIASGEQAKKILSIRLAAALNLHARIDHIEKGEISKINYQLQQLHFDERHLELKQIDDPEKRASIAKQRDLLKSRYEFLQKELGKIYQALNKDSITVKIMNGQMVEIPLAKIVRFYYPNEMSVVQKTVFYFSKFWEFLSADPRESNTEGGIFPALFGTITLVLIMSIFVTPFGVIAAIYLREYAQQGIMVRLIRIAVNNLAGVPSVVYGVFGLGFFVYFIGGNIDRLFFPEALPSPTFGSGGILWSSITLAILSLPVVIVATEEGLTRIPRAIREGSLALGATKAETLWRTVIPMASPAIMTGLILAIARAVGEVAPLMLVGVVKLAPASPIDASYPFLHLERKFMHLGFHIYDVGFQSPNVEAARPLVYATALLLVAVAVILNLSAIQIRNHLREKYQGFSGL